MIYDIEQLETLTDDQLWEVASDTHNSADIRQQAILRWLFPDATDPDATPDDMEGGRLRELRQRARVLHPDELEDDDGDDTEEMAPYFDTQGRLILDHDGVSYLIDTRADEDIYNGMNDRNNFINDR